MHRDDAQDAELSVTLADEPATLELGGAIGAHLGPGDVVCLEGELGAGKTTLVRGVHAAMACEGRVRSPTFATMIEYAGSPRLHHFDLFRYESAGRAFLDEFEEWLFGEGVSVIEWADRLGSHTPRPHLRVRLEVRGDGRVAHLRAEGARWRPVVAALSGGTHAR